jgi:GMP synthase (glutamine-hydrolysing)
MRKLLVFQHSAREPLGVFDPMLRRAGFRIRYINFSRQPDQLPDVSRYNGLIVLGGPMNVDQADRFPHLTTEIAAIQEALTRGIPILGICLGAHLLAAALGATVRPNNVRESAGIVCIHIGRQRQSALRLSSQKRVPVARVHLRPPPGAIIWPARRPALTRQTIRRSRYGLQFHPGDEQLISAGFTCRNIAKKRRARSRASTRHILQHAWARAALARSAASVR